MKQFIIINKNVKTSKRTIAQLCAKAWLMYTKVSNFIQRWKWFVNKTPTVICRIQNWEETIHYLEMMKIKYYQAFNKKGDEVMIMFFHESDEYLDDLELY